MMMHAVMLPYCHVGVLSCWCIVMLVYCHVGFIVVFEYCRVGVLSCRCIALLHGSRDDLILSAKLIRIAPETSSF
jgi:hypothetical protein